MLKSADWFDYIQNLDQSLLDIGNSSNPAALTTPPYSNNYSKNSVYTCRAVTYAPPFTNLPVGVPNTNYYTNTLNPISTTFIKPSALHNIGVNTISSTGVNLLNTNAAPLNQAFDLSTFSNMYDSHSSYGIYSSKINLTLGKQYFYNIHGFSGCGIQSAGTFGSTGITVNVGTNSTGANYFTNCTQAINNYSQTNYFNVSGNTILNCSNGINLSNFNFSSQTPTNPNTPNCIINNNHLTNITYKGISLNTNNTIVAQVQTNDITNTIHNTTSTGIVINEILYSNLNANALYTINNNHINYLFNGVVLYGTNSAQVTSNTIQLYSLTSYPQNLYNYGINMANNYNDNISNNIITGNNVSYTWGQYGINASDAVKSQIYCNQITGTNVGLNFQGYMPSNVYTNSLTNQLVDVWLLNGGVIGPQYNPNTSIVTGAPWYLHIYQPSDNSFTNTGLYYSYCSNSTNGASSTFYIRHGLPWDMTFNSAQGGIPVSTSMVPQYPTPFFPPSNNCTACVGNCRQVQLAQQVAQNSLFAVTDVRNTAVSRQRLFQNLMLENISTVGDTILTNFKNAAANSNIGKLFNIQTNITNAMAQNNAALFANAQQANNSLVPTNVVESRQKALNTAYLNYITNGFTYKPADLINLRQLAALCPFTDGTAVWQARALLASVDTVTYFNTCEIVTPPVLNTGSRLAHTENNEPVWQDAKVSIYPNPNNGSFVVSYAGIGKQVSVEMYNTLGQQIMNKQYAVADASNIQLSGFEDGVYLVKILVDGALLKTDRIIVTK